MQRVLCISTGNSANELRARRLTSSLQADLTYYSMSPSASRWNTAQELRQLLHRDRWDLIYQEGTSIATGAVLIQAALTQKQPFIISSGDPIGGFFQVTKGPILGQFFGLYERLLYQTCTAFVGWTPYLTGIALKLGAKQAITIEGAVDLKIFHPYDRAQRLALRQKYGIPAEHLVCGVVGSLNWSSRQSYCYGYELIQTLQQVKRSDLSILIVGEGNGRSYLEAAIPEALRSRIFFTGRLPEAEVVDAMNMMDIGFVTQTLDALGSYRLTTKLPEYLACGVPVAMSPIPGFYDYVDTAGWPLPATHPSSSIFHQSCAHWLDRLSMTEIQQKAEQAPLVAQQHFDYERLSNKFCNFVQGLLDNKPTEALSFQLEGVR